MMRLGKKKGKAVTELAVGAVVSQNQRKNKGKMTLARSLLLCHIRKPTRDASRRVCECFGSLQPMQSEENAEMPLMEASVTGIATSALSASLAAHG